MRSVSILSAILAGGIAVVSGATTCTDDVKITQPTQPVDCDVVGADIIIDKSVSGGVVIDGPKTVKGNINATDCTKMVSLSSNTIQAVEGDVILDNGTLLSSVIFTALNRISGLRLTNLPQLNGLTFGTKGISKASVIQIIDTFISDLTGLNNIEEADIIDISNNPKLTTFDSNLVNVTKSLKLVDNGQMKVNMSRLEEACEMEFRKVTSFFAPALDNVCSIKINDSPELLNVTANNLTEISASFTLINNKKLSEISLKSLKVIKGDMTIVNNTALKTIDGFPELTSVGNILLGGNFEKVKLPKLTDVKGSVVVTSTTDISDFCQFFDDLKSNSKIRGKESCKSNNKNANSGDSTGGDSAGGNKTKEDAAGVISVNTAMLGLVGFAGIAQLL